MRSVLNSGADLNKKDKDGKTALMKAQDAEKESVIKILIAAGDNLNSELQFKS